MARRYSTIHYRDASRLNRAEMPLDSILERIRQQVETCVNRIGMLYDYLDRGRPSPDQNLETWKVVRLLEETSAVLRSEFEREFEETVLKDPGIIAEWAEAHSEICREVIGRAESSESLYPDHDLEILIARRLLREWTAVGKGEMRCVVQHSLMRESHGDLQRERFVTADDPVDNWQELIPWRRK